MKYLHTTQAKMAATTMRRTRRHVLLVMVKNSCSALPGSGRGAKSEGHASMASKAIAFSREIARPLTARRLAVQGQTQRIKVALAIAVEFIWSYKPSLSASSCLTRTQCHPAGFGVQCLFACRV
jgi:hypothetical protein